MVKAALKEVFAALPGDLSLDILGNSRYPSRHLTEFVLMPFWLIIAASCLLSGCTPWRVEYLEEVTGRATQDEITLKLGPPMAERTLSTSETVWLYRYSGASVDQYGGGTWCREYILKFDTQKILKEWNRQKC